MEFANILIRKFSASHRMAENRGGKLTHFTHKVGHEFYTLYLGDNTRKDSGREGLGFIFQERPRVLGSASVRS